MPDSPPASASGAARIAGLALAVAGAVGLAVAAFLNWFTVTVRPPEGASAAAFALLEARVSGIGTVTMPALGGIDVSSSVPNDLAWGGWLAVGIAVTIALLAAVATLGPAGQRRLGAAGVLVGGVAGIALGGYAAVVPVGTQTMTVAGVSLQTDTKAGIGPCAVIVAAVIATLGALALLLVRRSAPAVAQPAPQAPSNQQYPPANAAWARPVAPPMPAPTPPPLPVPAPVPDEQIRTAVAPVARRRPQPDWDRNWPGTLPPKPGPLTPSEQHTQVVKRPPRPVRVSPKPETEAIPRRDPRFDSPTQP